MVLARMPRGASSTASVRVKLVTAAFMAAYTAKPGAARCPSMEVRLMMLPAPATRMRGMASCVACSNHVKLVRMMASQPRGVDSSNGWRNVPPTTLTSTSSRSPKRASTWVKNSVTDSVSRA